MMLWLFVEKEINSYKPFGRDSMIKRLKSITYDFVFPPGVEITIMNVKGKKYKSNLTISRDLLDELEFIPGISNTITFETNGISKVYDARFINYPPLEDAEIAVELRRSNILTLTITPKEH